MNLEVVEVGSALPGRGPHPDRVRARDQPNGHDLHLPRRPGASGGESERASFDAVDDHDGPAVGIIVARVAEAQRIVAAARHLDARPLDPRAVAAEVDEPRAGVTGVARIDAGSTLRRAPLALEGYANRRGRSLGDPGEPPDATRAVAVGVPGRVVSRVEVQRSAIERGLSRAVVARNHR